jgi:chromosome segregation ATPase
MDLHANASEDRQKKIGKLEKELESLDEKKSSLLNHIERVDKKIDELGKEKASLTQKVSTYQHQLSQSVNMNPDFN